MTLFWCHLLLRGRHLLTIIGEKSWMSSRETDCPKVYETLKVSHFTCFEQQNSTLTAFLQNLVNLLKNYNCCYGQIWYLFYYVTLSAVQFLQDTGNLIHVSDHTHILTDLYFLDPAWLCDVLLAVIQAQKHHETHRSGHMVRREHLEKICVESGFENDWFEEYLELLGRFDIALPAGDNW